MSKIDVVFSVFIGETFPSLTVVSFQNCVLFPCYMPQIKFGFLSAFHDIAAVCVLKMP